MEEFKFVLKCFLFACLLVIFSQSKINNETIENQAYAYLQNSSTAEFVRGAAEGGVKLLQRGYLSTRNFIQEKISGTSSFENKENKPKFLRPVYSQDLQRDLTNTNQDQQ